MRVGYDGDGTVPAGFIISRFFTIDAEGMSALPYTLISEQNNFAQASRKKIRERRAKVEKDRCEIYERNVTYSACESFYEKPKALSRMI